MSALLFRSCALTIAISTITSNSLSADHNWFLHYENGRTDPREEKLAEAIRKGDLAAVKVASKDMDLRRYWDLDVHVLHHARNADVIRYLRDVGGLNISDMQIAVASGDVRAARRLFPSRPRSDAISGNYGSFHSPLLLAIRLQDERMVKMLIKRGVTVNETLGLTVGDKDVKTPLKRAIERGNPKIVRLLVHAGASITGRHGDDPRFSPFAKAISSGRSQVVAILLDAGADPNLLVGEKTRVLHVAARIGNPAIVKLLLKKGADVNAQDDEGRRSLGISYYAGDIADLLRAAGAREPGQANSEVKPDAKREVNPEPKSKETPEAKPEANPEEKAADQKQSAATEAQPAAIAA